jgi:hypothetical protein
MEIANGKYASCIWLASAPIYASMLTGSSIEATEMITLLKNR